MKSSLFVNKSCPICSTNRYSKIIYKANLENNIDNINYSGRKKPDGLHYEMVRCMNCSLLYAKQIYDNNVTKKLYTDSNFVYESEIKGLKKTYGHCLREGEKTISNKENFLEIGCGCGFVLELAQNNGWKHIMGVEPSLKSIENSHPDIKSKIVNSFFNVDNYQDNFFDIIFVAMLIEHVSDINKFLSDIYKILKPGGSLVTICHDENHFLSKLLKNKHPIINDEHNYIFSSNTIKQIYTKNKFKKLKIKNLKNYYTLGYWIKMMPIKLSLPNIFNLSLLNKILKINIGFKAGNIFIIAKK